jgi:subtilisin family serine protease
MKPSPSARRNTARLVTTAKIWAFAATWVLLAAPLVAGSDLADTSGQAPAGAALALPEPTSELLIFLRPGTDVAEFTQARGLQVKYRLQSDPDAYVLVADSADAAAKTLKSLASDASVRASYLNVRTRYVKMAFVPNDPYFHKDTPAAGWPGQWHLLNEHTPGLDARVAGAWARDVTGMGVIVGIVDDSVEIAHPDLAPNISAADCYDFGQGDSDPSPVYASDEHGVSVSGVTAARGGNGIGVTGAAPYAGIAGLRVDFPNQTTAMFVDATLYHSSGSNTNIKVKNHSYGIGAPYILSSAENAALATSAAAGTIHCFAAGNERGTPGEDSNKKHTQSSPDCIAVAALGSDGKYAYYSCFGANIFVTAPSSSSTGLFAITTTDRTTEAFGYNGAGDAFPDPDYTSLFGGTSSASPLVTGVMVLGKQAQPGLNVRFAKHLLVRTCDVVDAGDATQESDGGWKTNAAGRKFNQNYGFGLIDADGFTQLAAQYAGTTAMTTASTGNIAVGAAIPDNNAAGISNSVPINPASPQPLEEVLVTLNIAHPNRGNVEAFVTSPSGTSSRLMFRSASDTGANISWTFETNAFWGESPSGTWTVMVRDVFAGVTGTWSSYSITLHMGELSATRISGRVTLGAAGLAGVTMTGLPGNPVTDAAGLYRAEIPPNWSGVVVPTLGGYVFTPASRTYDNVSVSMANEDYVAEKVTYKIAGRVTDTEGAAVEGVVLDGLPNDPATGPDGSYTVTVDYGFSGLVTPTKVGYTFTPSARSYFSIVASRANEDYSARLQTYRLAGRILYQGSGVANVAMNGLPGTPVTDNEGYYRTTVNFGWNGTATPSKTGYSFTPASRDYQMVTAALTAENYAASETQLTISGRVTVDGEPLSGASMQGLPGTPNTDAEGVYSGTVSYGWSGTVTPVKEWCTFAPVKRTYSGATTDLADQDYDATKPTFTISGHVIAGSKGVGGVALTGLPGTPVTDSDGAYKAAVSAGWSGTVHPVKSGYSFDPTRRNYGGVSGVLTGEDYHDMSASSGGGGSDGQPAGLTCPTVGFLPVLLTLGLLMWLARGARRG